MPPTNLPKPISEPVGRDDVLGEILGLPSAHRLITLTDAGGARRTLYNEIGWSLPFELSPECYA